MTRDKPCIDRGTLAQVTGGDAALERRLFAQFLQICREDVANVCAAIARRDCGLAGQAAHRLRGSSATLGANDLAAACQNVEQAARQGLIGRVEERLEELESAVRRVTDYLAQEMQRAHR